MFNPKRSIIIYDCAILRKTSMQMNWCYKKRTQEQITGRSFFSVVRLLSVVLPVFASPLVEDYSRHHLNWCASSSSSLSWCCFSFVHILSFRWHKLTSLWFVTVYLPCLTQRDTTDNILLISIHFNRHVIGIIVHLWNPFGIRLARVSLYLSPALWLDFFMPIVAIQLKNDRVAFCLFTIRVN